MRQVDFAKTKLIAPYKRKNYRWPREDYPDLYKVVEPYIKKISSTYKNLYKYFISKY